jgi:hypothetical protein
LVSIRQDHVATARSLQSLATARHHGHDDVRVSMEPRRRDHTHRSAFGSPQVRVREWREIDLAAVHVLARSADGRIWYLVVDGVVAGEPVRHERRSGRPGRPGPAKQPLPEPPEVLLSSVDGFLGGHGIVRPFGRSYRSLQPCETRREVAPVGFSEVIFRSRRSACGHALHLKAGGGKSPASGGPLRP